ncbi:hypothetical protein FE257_012001 [Aspergillus nanangensis]|uniref:NAD(P)-binding protein n=1 Tax=Aspergillus nanangensis TaxID=2582783 RepID=A0AAD4CGP4_ASPNN|nr:hypothetical protein FE257_012001 [Aspergillus nanangensis]
MNSPYQVTGTAFITGGGSGIGKRTAFTFAQNGLQGLALLDVNKESLNQTKTELKAQYPSVEVEVFSVNITREEDVATAVRATVEKFGRIDILVHGAGIVQIPAQTHELPIAEWQKVIDVNQTGLLVCQKWIVRQMLAQEPRGKHGDRGTIVNISSALGCVTTRSSLGNVAYTAAKHAVNGITKNDARAYAKDGIRINAICPGYVDTPLIHHWIADGSLQTEVDHAALGRPAEVEEIANVVLFLASPMSSYMCGSTLVVDGGYSA